MGVGDRIVAIRKQQGLSQRALAKACGVSQPTISAIESSTKAPSTVTVMLIADALHTPVSVLMGETELSGNEKDPLHSEVLSLFDALTDEKKKEIIALMEFMKGQMK